MGWRIARKTIVVSIAIGFMHLTNVRAATIELSNVAAGTGGFAITGMTPHTLSGVTNMISPAGDVNGDGFADFIIGALGADPNGINNAGQVFVVFGKADTAAVAVADLVTANKGIVINGSGSGDQIGGVSLPVGDINGDGLDDFGTTVSGGRMLVVFGRLTSATLDADSIANGLGGGYGLQGIHSAASVGDLNGDGLGDVFGVGVQASVNFPYAYFSFGKSSFAPILAAEHNSGAGEHRIFFDLSVASSSGRALKDVNGDGRGDGIANFAEADLGTSASYVLFGKADAGTTTATLAGIGSDGFVVRGANFALHAERTGDVNGDGLADMFAREIPGGSATRTFVIFGKSDSNEISVADVKAGIGGFAITELAVSGSVLQIPMGSAGDVNGDGLEDLILGDFDGDQPGRSNCGVSYVIFGKTATTPVLLSNIIAGVGGFAINGTVTDARTGHNATSAGDVNGDGLSDLLVHSRVASGQAFVVFSPMTPAVQGAYKMHTRAGDGAGGELVPPTDFGDVARAKVDFSDADSGAASGGGASLETVTIHRSGLALSGPGLPSPRISTTWQIETDRQNFTSADLTLKYTNTEIAAFSAQESDLAIFKASSPSGPWTKLNTTVDTTRNTVKATVASFSYFAVGLTPSEVEDWAAFDR